MLDLDTYTDFEPSTTTKNLWRYVRKLSTREAGITLPGVFSIAHFELDTLGFCTAIGLEAWGLASLLRVGNVEAIYVAFLFMIDLLFAVFRHLPMAGICEYKNRLVIEDNPAAKRILERKIARKKIIVWLFSSLIILVALVKVLIFYALQQNNFTTLTALILLSYLVAAMLHITVTGYFLFGLFTELLKKYDESLYLRSKESGAQNPRVTIGGYRETRPFTATSKIEEVFMPLLIGDYGQHLEKVPGEADKYRFRTWGILTDQQLRTMINCQRDRAAGLVVAREGLSHQLDILQQDPQQQTQSRPERSPEAERGIRHESL